MLMCLILLLHIRWIAGFRFIISVQYKVYFCGVCGAQQGKDNMVVDAVGQFANSAVTLAAATAALFISPSSSTQHPPVGWEPSFPCGHFIIDTSPVAAVLRLVFACGE